MSINPQAFMNGYLSGLRNGIITMSLGVAIFGFSRTFEKQSSRDAARIVSVLSYLVSLSISTLTTLQLREYLSKLTVNDKRNMPKYINLENWKKYEYIGWLVVSMSVIMTFLGLKKYIDMVLELVFNIKLK